MLVEHNFSLENFNTFHIAEKAEMFLRIKSQSELLLAMRQAKSLDKPVGIIGGGSNILLTQPLTGITILNELKGIQIDSETEDVILVTFASGENWHDCVMWAVDKQLSGIENLSLIPGTMGAAPIQNIGAYGVELKDVFERCECLQLDHLTTETFNAESCEFGYRDSVFKHKLKGKYFILSVTLRLKKQPALRLDYGNIKEYLADRNILDPSIKDVSDAVIAIRKSKLPDPIEIGNAGSFFKNPLIDNIHFEKLIKEFPEMPSYKNDEKYKIPAAWLIEKIGWKGFREHDYGVHQKQALVLVNYANAKGSDIFSLSERIITSVQQRFNIVLEREVNIW